MKKLLRSLAVCLMLCGCAAQPPAPETTAPSQTEPPALTTAPTDPVTAPTEPLPTRPAEPVYVYPGAVEQFLDLEERSSEQEEKPELVMIHFTSAVMLQPEDPYDLAANRAIFENDRISIHYLIGRDGTVYCYVPEDRMAWHAGKGSYGEERYTNKMNYYAIGIELLAIGSAEDMSVYMSRDKYDALDDSLIGFTDAQYEALRLLVADICGRNGIPMDRTHVIGHQDYNPEKTDPGQLFDWARLGL